MIEPTELIRSHLVNTRYRKASSGAFYSHRDVIVLDQPEADCRGWLNGKPRFTEHLFLFRSGWMERVFKPLGAIWHGQLILDAEPVVVRGMDRAWRAMVAAQSRGYTIRPNRIWFLELGGVLRGHYSRKKAWEMVMFVYRNALGCSGLNE